MHIKNKYIFIHDTIFSFLNALSLVGSSFDALFALLSYYKKSFSNQIFTTTLHKSPFSQPPVITFHHSLPRPKASITWVYLILFWQPLLSSIPIFALINLG